MYIRQATHKDVDLLVTLGKRTFFDTFAADNDPADIEQYLAQAFSRDQVQAELMASASTFLLAYDTPNPGNQLLGYAHLKDNTEPCVTGNHPLEVVRLYVDKGMIGKGYGAKLMQSCLDHAAQEGFDTIWLGVWEKNYRAQKFYARWGFQQVGSHDFLMGKDLQTDWILMRAVVYQSPEERVL